MGIVSPYKNSKHGIFIFLTKDVEGPVTGRGNHGEGFWMKLR